VTRFARQRLNPSKLRPQITHDRPHPPPHSSRVRTHRLPIRVLRRGVQSYRHDPHVPLCGARNAHHARRVGRRHVPLGDCEESAEGGRVSGGVRECEL
jgi:hypothetical protein